MCNFANTAIEYIAFVACTAHVHTHTNTRSEQENGKDAKLNIRYFVPFFPVIILLRIYRIVYACTRNNTRTLNYNSKLFPPCLLAQNFCSAKSKMLQLCPIIATSTIIDDDDGDGNLMALLFSLTLLDYNYFVGYFFSINCALSSHLLRCSASYRTHSFRVCSMQRIFVKIFAP